MGVRKVIEMIVALDTQGGETHPIQHWMRVLEKCLSLCNCVRRALWAACEEEVLLCRGNLTSGAFTFCVFDFAT